MPKTLVPRIPQAILALAPWPQRTRAGRPLLVCAECAEHPVPRNVPQIIGGATGMANEQLLLGDLKTIQQDARRSIYGTRQDDRLS